ncbi:glycosyltransferase family 2 protein [Komagataeibacter sp. AV436]|uniref:Glycosyltransferase family 2 protein n=1 Tax=Komagataeibacter melomenusus TaxID=2766578 RepID=A0ABX2AFN5_9PROT|nr:glycosyltransferase family 2 protein [Komagataeibacter melomenusus]MBV1830583.1 glycosyltransferase family 2 protein [Komagataeibacter melomenusus]NPC66590.1 glycosyltransferase family 2 protein [Komagataeibacter melomenusus]
MTSKESLPLPEYSVVVPCYNEGENLRVFHERLFNVMQMTGKTWEVVYVNDGSTDDTAEVITALGEKADNIAYLNLSRNFGKEICLTAGLDHARGTDAVIIIDADLQDPPEVITDLIAAYKDVDTVYAQRRSRKTDSWLKRLTAFVFYRVMVGLSNRITIPPDTGDFRLISRRALDALLSLRERHRFMKGLFAWIGFPSRAVLYDRDARYGGYSSFNYWKLWNFALEGITSFTTVPLKIATYIGLITSTVALFYGTFLLIRTLIFGNSVSGYPSLMTAILFLGGIQLMAMGIIGEYLGRVFNETKQRPLYIVERYVNNSKKWD